ncbi:MAG TPA: dihydrodipicolinate synthase family protein [Bacteroidales bacterium]|nr:dihydrodipicolinate synthase family protein [Bacteroidales bacterium]
MEYINRTFPGKILTLLQRGAVIPALPLALNSLRKFDERRQRALIRYYLDAGAGGVAVGVHTTQFAIRDKSVNLFEPLLRIAEEEFDLFERSTGRNVIRISGVIGKTPQARNEANLAVKNGYNAALLSLAAFAGEPNSVILKHCRTISEIIPIVGFYLQPAVGGRVLDTDFWRGLCEIPNVVAVKIAPFNRYHTLDVVKGLAQSGRSDIALYTGNDDNILADLLTEYSIPVNGSIYKKRIVGGLLGHWAVWTRSAVKLLEDVHKGAFNNDTINALSLAARITDCNAAFFDAAHNFKGCITGLHEVLRRQGLLENNLTLDADDQLSPSQRSEIDRVYAAYPDLNDDEFVRVNLSRWLS